MEPFLVYVEETYICGQTKPPGRGKKAAKIVPLFPPNVWSMYGNVLGNIPRTSNQAESWHNRWTKIVGAKHVGVIRILEEIKREMKYSSGLIATIMSGKQNRKRKREDTARESRMFDIVKNYNKFPLPVMMHWVFEPK